MNVNSCNSSYYYEVISANNIITVYSITIGLPFL